MDLKVLVIKSASLERLDCLMDKLNLPENSSVEILGHSHQVSNLSVNYPAVKVVEYPFDGSFKRSNVTKLIREGKLKGKYDFVIFPVSNVSGGGHFNVVKTALLFAGSVRIFNLNGEFIEISADSIWREKFFRIAVFPAVISGTLLISIWGIWKLAAGFLMQGVARAKKTETAHGK